MQANNYLREFYLNSKLQVVNTQITGIFIFVNVGWRHTPRRWKALQHFIFSENLRQNVAIPYIIRPKHMLNIYRASRKYAKSL